VFLIRLIFKKRVFWLWRRWKRWLGKVRVEDWWQNRKQFNLWRL